jgi:hypothetical protein
MKSQTNPAIREDSVGAYDDTDRIAILPANFMRWLAFRQGATVLFTCPGQKRLQ